MPVPPDKRGKKTIKKIINYFIQGVIILAPIGLTAYLLYWLFEKVDGILRPYLAYLHVNIPGIGFIIIIVFVILVGWVSSNYLMSSLINFFNHFLERTPGVKFIYSSIKDFFEAFAGEKRKFNKSVLVNIYSADVWVIGFVTDEELHKFELGDNMIAVYVPKAYGVIGQLYLLPRDRVKKIEHLSSGQVMKYAVTGGVVGPDEEAADEKK